MSKTVGVAEHVSGILPVVPGKWIWKEETKSLDFVSANPMAERDRKKKNKRRK